jgi:hypothetical protein
LSINDLQMETGGIEFRVPLFRKYCNDNYLAHKHRRVQRLRIDYTRLLLTVGAVQRLHLLGTDWAHLGRGSNLPPAHRRRQSPTNWPKKRVQIEFTGHSLGTPFAERLPQIH